MDAIIILLGLILLVMLFKTFVRKRHPTQPTGLGAVLARRCTSCRTIIDGFAKVCPHCSQVR
jgi:hypothetical protein